MSPALLQAIGYAWGISLGILALVSLVHFLMRRFNQQPASPPPEAQSTPEPPATPVSTQEGSPSA